MIEAKAEQNGKKSPFHKIIYANLVADPLGEVKKMYNYFNISFTEDTERHLRKYLKNDPKKTKYGTHKYSMDKFQLTDKRLEREFAVYNSYMSACENK